MQQASDSSPPDRTRQLLIGCGTLAVLLLLCGACAGGLYFSGLLEGVSVPGLAPAPSATPTPEPTPTLAPTPTEDLDLDAPPTYTFTSTGVEQFDSYELSYTFETDAASRGGESGVDRIEVYVARQTEPLSAQVGMSTESSRQGQSTVLNLTIIGEQGYLESIEGGSRDCVAAPPGPGGLGGTLTAENVGETLAPLNDVLAGMPPLERVMPNEEIGGVETRHYRAEGIDVMVNSEEVFDFIEFSGATIETWVAREGGFLVRARVAGGFDDGVDRGDISITYDLLSFNQPLGISPPADCPPR